jgi:hypothetical protein
MPVVACPGPCNHRWRQARAAYDKALAEYDPLDADQRRPSPPEITAVAGCPWCGDCQATIKRELSEIGRLVAHLTANADGYAADTAPGQRVTGSPGHRSPSPAHNLYDEVDSVLYARECEWWQIRFGHTTPPDRRGFLADKFTDTLVWLLEHFSGMICHPGIGQPFGEEIRDWHRRLRARSKTGPGVHHKTLPCPRCGMVPSLSWREGDDYVRCGNRDCGRMLSLADYDAYAADPGSLRAVS